jgi:hypothetical protein
VGAFSGDGQWWWDGHSWVATSQVTLPQLSMTEYQRSGKLKIAQSEMRKRAGVIAADEASVIGGSQISNVVGLALLLPSFVLQQRAFRDYRLWTLEQLALATTFLLGPDEPMVAGETTMFRTLFLATAKRDFAIAVTAAHVLVFRIDFLDGQPRWVALASRPSDVKIELSSGGPFGYNPMLVVTHGSWQWQIRGTQRVFQPEPVLQAWRQAAAENP